MKEKEEIPGQVEIAELLRQRLPNPVRLVFFWHEGEATSAAQRKLLEALARLSDRLSVEIHDFGRDAEAARRFGIDKAPATAVVGVRDYGLRFFGVTGGYEFSSLLEAILLAASGQSGLAPEHEAWVTRLDVPTHIEVLVTLTCPYCPRMVHLAQQLAVANELVRADAVDSAEFPDLSRRYGVGTVPLTVVNGRRLFEGALPPADGILEILRAVKPDEFEAVEAELRTAAGARQVKPAEPGHLYDVLVLGAGPAALSAAVYATRKALDVALVGDRLGGQVNDTASIENWLGAPSVGGQDLAGLFRAHVENYALAERLRARVVSVEREAEDFRAVTADGAVYRGRTVVYCAGKQYRRLNVPGEDRFLGRGVAFCATCDAPLYRGKKVAVVGGGNSGFTAARDLLPYADEIHIINVVPDFQADAVLIDEVVADPRVRLHPSTRVLEFLGEGELEGVRLEAADGTGRFDLPVEGVFLEIGLVPNSGPVAGLVPLNDQGEVLVNRDQSTAVPGFFAAGDVTDEPEKQIVVAEGAGAKAGLAACSYLAARGRGKRTGGW